MVNNYYKERAPLKFKETKKKRLYEDVLEQLQDYLIREKIEFGQKLPPERELAKIFNVNRVSVREALTVLETSGLVERKTRGGTFSTGAASFAGTSLLQVIAKNKHLIKEPMQVRRVIEPQLARLAALNINDDLLKYLNNNLEQQQERIIGGLDIIDLDREFHYIIAKATDNAIFIGMIEALHDSLEGTRVKSLRFKEGGCKSFHGHKEIYAALEAHDPYKAEEAMTNHLKQVESLILGYILEQAQSEMVPSK